MNTALIVAAGISSRTQLNYNKILYPVNDKPLFLYSLEKFLELDYEIILVCAKQDMTAITRHIGALPSSAQERIRLVSGGKTRSESVQNGLKEVTTPYVFIHDAARPLITKETILKIEEALALHDAVLLASNPTHALKKKKGTKIKSVLRTDYIKAETPQSFLTEKIRYAYLRTKGSYTDDVELYQRFYEDEDVHVIVHDDPNPKVTYKQDFLFINAVLGEKHMIRIGHSYDVHRLIEGRPLILGGIEIPHDRGLLGHSDADVLLHAVAESLLGALALGDLGTHFPDNDAAYQGMDSSIILRACHDMVLKKGYEIGNIDATVYAEAPRLSPHIPDMRKHIAEQLGIESQRISIKATTHEKLGEIGQNKAIAAEAVALLKKV
jgi:2-C-methyl-D-erythritol 4-phosphate cytidylyltransferase / 2-C-methyl-D-erythritol 2,4-cyclodiphosphate synthase